MDVPPSIQTLDRSQTTWHITFGTYGARLHGDERPTVDRQHNVRGEPFLSPTRGVWRSSGPASGSSPYS